MVNVKIVVFCLSVLVAVEAQRCTPGIVPNMNVTNNQIQWSTALNPDNCSINAYVINIFDLEDGTQFQHRTGPSERAYNLANLDMCKNYTLEVHALTDQEVYGPATQINATIPPTASANLTLSISNVTHNDSQLFLSWNATNASVERCISYYRVVYWDENDSPIDVYVPTTYYTLQQIPIACMEYKFQVSAIVDNPDIEGPLAEVSFDGYTAVSDPPTIVSIVTTNTTVNMVWKVPTYAQTRCNLTSLVVYTLGLPARNSTTSVIIHDSPLRPNVAVFIESLTPNVVYTSYVHLQNVAGSSKNITATFQTSDSFVFDFERDISYDD